MAKQSLFSPANAKGSNYILMQLVTRETDDSIAHKLADMTHLSSAILSSMLKVFLLITELLMSSISISLFSCSVENLSIFTALFLLTLVRKGQRARQRTRQKKKHIHK